MLILNWLGLPEVIDYLKETEHQPTAVCMFCRMSLWLWTMMLPKKDVSLPTDRAKCPVLVLWVSMYRFLLLRFLETILVQTTSCLFCIYSCPFVISLPFLVSFTFLLFCPSLFPCLCPALPTPHSSSKTQAFFLMKMMKNKPLVRSCSVCSARERSYSLK